MVRNERIIKNIDQEHGVTAEQLLNHFNKIVNTIPAAKFLNNEQKQSAVHDTVVAVKKKMDEGILDKYDYQKFRGYIFKALTVTIWNYNKIKLYYKNSINDKAEEIDYDYSKNYELNGAFVEHEPEKWKLLIEGVKLMDPKKQELFWGVYHWNKDLTYRQIEEKLGTKYRWETILSELRKISQILVLPDKKERELKLTKYYNKRDAAQNRKK